MQYWFKPRRFGYGATPTTWQGWVTALVFLALIVAIQIALPPVGYGRELAVNWAVTAAVTVLFVWIAWKKDGWSLALELGLPKGQGLRQRIC